MVAPVFGSGHENHSLLPAPLASIHLDARQAMLRCAKRQPLIAMPTLFVKQRPLPAIRLCSTQSRSIQCNCKSRQLFKRRCCARKMVQGLSTPPAPSSTINFALEVSHFTAAKACRRFSLPATVQGLFGQTRHGQKTSRPRQSRLDASSRFTSPRSHGSPCRRALHCGHRCLTPNPRPFNCSAPSAFQTAARRPSNPAFVMGRGLPLDGLPESSNAR